MLIKYEIFQIKSNNFLFKFFQILQIYLQNVKSPELKNKNYLFFLYFLNRSYRTIRPCSFKKRFLFSNGPRLIVWQSSMVLGSVASL